jgi:hypothetical protein
MVFVQLHYERPVMVLRFRNRVMNRSIDRAALSAYLLRLVCDLLDLLFVAIELDLAAFLASPTRASSV